MAKGDVVKVLADLLLLLVSWALVWCSIPWLPVRLLALAMIFVILAVTAFAVTVPLLDWALTWLAKRST